MCGICLIFSSSREFVQKKDINIENLLSCRGPDLNNSLSITVQEEFTGLFRGCVLWLQGNAPQKQPINDEEGNILLWNGDNFYFERDLTVSDSYSLFEAIRGKSAIELIKCFSRIEGPWSFVYYSASSHEIYFGRDVFGRRSLLWTPPQNCDSSFVLTSVDIKHSGLTEVPAVGIFSAKLESIFNKNKKFELYPFTHLSADKLVNYETASVEVMKYALDIAIEIPLCKMLPPEDIMIELKGIQPLLKGENLGILQRYFSGEIIKFSKAFGEAIKKRIKACPPKCKNCTDNQGNCTHSKFAIMFSGGLDSALIAWFVAQHLPPNESIDLLNVSFETKNPINLKKGNCKPEDNVLKSGSFDSPDRKSALACFRDLLVCYKLRKWNLVEINVTSEELQKDRQQYIRHLIAPQSSVLDDSIGCALYFCGKGKGNINGEPYTTPARVLFSGLGADEQLGGYTRHRGKFEVSGWEGLVGEIELEMGRIHSRNCGRDDRVLSHHGRVVRFPFLDEGVVSCLNSFPIWKKVNLYLPRGVGEKILLRVIAAANGLTSAAVLPKRAIQFGSRIAKMENNKEKGNDSCERLG